MSAPTDYTVDDTNVSLTRCQIFDLWFCELQEEKEQFLRWILADGGQAYMQEVARVAALPFTP